VGLFGMVDGDNPPSRAHRHAPVPVGGQESGLAQLTGTIPLLSNAVRRSRALSTPVAGAGSREPPLVGLLYDLKPIRVCLGASRNAARE
jgi:hypothetical protein